VDQIKKIELIIQLRNSALTMWGYLITVSLGVTAYLGTQQFSIEPIASIALIFLYGLFAISNANALLTNFKSRNILSDYEKEDDNEELSKFIKLNSLDNKSIKINMIFHLIVDNCVIAMILFKTTWN